jgi:hypothetical protein
MGANDQDGDPEWRFGVDDVGEEAETEAEAARAVEPGEPTLEGALFFFAGVCFTLALLATLVV